MVEDKKMRINDITARIAKLEEEREKLLPLRKEEIFNVLKAVGGLAIDNSLLAGIALYAGSKEAKNSEFLSELRKIGRNYLPRPQKSPDCSAIAADSTANIFKKDSIKAEKVNG